MHIMNQLLRLTIIICFCLSASPSIADSTGPCSIDNMSVELIECNEDGTYDVNLYYSISNPADGTLSVFVNTIHYGDFTIGGPLLIENISPSEFYDTDIFLLCFTENEDCNYTYEFLQPECLDCVGPCSVSDIQVQILGCSEDGTNYTAQIFYTVNNPDHETIHLYINYEYYGEYEIGQSIIIDGIYPREQSDEDIIQLVINDMCSGEFEYPQPDCLNNTDFCNIFDIEIVDWICNADGILNAIFIDYQVINPSDSLINLEINGENYGGYSVGEIIGVDVQGNEFFITLSFENGDCGESEQFFISCTDCNWGGIEVGEFECEGDLLGGFIFYNYQNPPSEEVFVEIDGIGIGPNPVNEPIFFVSGNELVDIFLYFNIDGDTLCTTELVVDNPCFENCDLGCLDGILTTSYECYESDPGYYLEINADLACDSTLLIVSVDPGTIYSYYSNETWVFDFVPYSSTGQLNVNVCFDENPNCCTTYVLEEPPCNTNLCSIDSMDVVVNCIENGLYYLEGYAYTSNVDDGAYAYVYLSSPSELILIDTFPVVEDFVQIFNEGAPFPYTPGSYELVVCIGDLEEECCESIVVTIEDCSPDCCVDQTEAVIQTECLNDSLTYFIISYNIPCSPDESLTIFVDNNQPMSIPSGQGEFELESIPIVDNPTVTICQNELDCCKTFTYDYANCFNGPDDSENFAPEITMEQNHILIKTKDDSTVQLLDSNGRAVLNDGALRKQHSILSSHFPTGIYFISVMGPHNRVTKKMLISN